MCLPKQKKVKKEKTARSNVQQIFAGDGWSIKVKGVGPNLRIRIKHIEAKQYEYIDAMVYSDPKLKFVQTNRVKRKFRRPSIRKRPMSTQLSRPVFSEDPLLLHSPEKLFENGGLTFRRQSKDDEQFDQIFWGDHKSRFKESLPLDLQTYIFYLVGATEVIKKAQLVSRRWFGLSTLEKLWKKFYQDDFGPSKQYPDLWQVNWIKCRKSALITNDIKNHKVVLKLGGKKKKKKKTNQGLESIRDEFALCDFDLDILIDGSEEPQDVFRFQLSSLLQAHLKNLHLKKSPAAVKLSSNCTISDGDIVTRKKVLADGTETALVVSGTIYSLLYMCLLPEGVAKRLPEGAFNVDEFVDIFCVTYPLFFNAEQLADTLTHIYSDPLILKQDKGSRYSHLDNAAVENGVLVQLELPEATPILILQRRIQILRFLVCWVTQFIKKRGNLKQYLSLSRWHQSIQYSEGSEEWKKEYSRFGLALSDWEQHIHTDQPHEEDHLADLEGSVKQHAQNPELQKAVKLLGMTEKKRIHQEPFSFLDYNCRTFAEHMTAKDAEIVSKIRPEEFYRGAWGKAAHKEVKAPNITAMVNRFNQLSFWIQTSIVSEERVKKRADVIVYFVKLASQLLSLNNFLSLMAINASLSGTPIMRLKKTWRNVPDLYRKELKELHELFSPEANFKVYRERLAQTTPPLIPFIAVWLGDITFINESPDFFDKKDDPAVKLINYDKMTALGRIFLDLKRYQSALPEYSNFEHDAKLLAYLSYSKIGEGGTFTQSLFGEREMYLESRKLEPPPARIVPRKQSAKVAHRKRSTSFRNMTKFAIKRKTSPVTEYRNPILGKQLKPIKRKESTQKSRCSWRRSAELPQTPKRSKLDGLLNSTYRRRKRRSLSCKDSSSVVKMNL